MLGMPAAAPLPTFPDDAPQTYVSKGRYVEGPGTFRAVWRVTAHGVARWCDAYRVEPSTRVHNGGPVEHFPGREGTLPADPAARHTALEELFDWLEQTRGTVFRSVRLTRAGDVVMDDDGLPFALWLTPTQFATLQAWWARFGLPRDLCFALPGSAEDLDPLFGPDTVTEAELTARKQRLVADCGRLLQALSVRTQQLWYQNFELPDHLLHAPALATDAAEERVVQELSAAVGRALLTLARLANGWGPSPPEPETVEDDAPPA
jgi:hypothetical protein